MQRQLKLQRFEVTVANHGQEALDILLAETTGAGSGNPIGIVLMDIEVSNHCIVVSETSADEKVV